MAKKDTDLRVILKPFPPEKLFSHHCDPSDWKLGPDVQIRVNLENIKIEPSENEPDRDEEGNLEKDNLIGVEILPVPAVLDPSELFAQYHEIVSDYESNCTVCHQLILLLTQHIRETHKNAGNQNLDSDRPCQSENSEEDHEFVEIQNQDASQSSETEISSVVSEPRNLDSSAEIEIPPQNYKKFEEIQNPSVGTEINSVNIEYTMSLDAAPPPPVQKSAAAIRKRRSKYRNIESKKRKETIGHDHRKNVRCPKCPAKVKTNTAFNEHPKEDVAVEENISEQLEGEGDMESDPDSDPEREFDKTNKKNPNLLKQVKCKNRRPYWCKMCNFSFFNQKYLTNHLKTHPAHTDQKERGSMSYSCHICSKPCSTVAKLHGHYGSHHKGMPKKCTMCKYCCLLFFNYQESKAHMEQDHPDQLQFVCKFCKKIYPNKTELKYHLQRRHSSAEKQFKCSEPGCGKAYFMQGELNFHMKSHTGLTIQYKCEIKGCDRVCTTLHLLRVHIRSHTGEKPFICEICAKSFTSSMGLKSHLVVHKEENGVRVKPWACDSCDSTFALKGQLTAHYLKHTGERRHMCEECGKRFILPSHLRTHLKIHMKK